MIDIRFYESLGDFSIDQIAQWCDGTIHNPNNLNVKINAVAAANNANIHTLSFIETNNNQKIETNAGLVLINEKNIDNLSPNIPAIIVRSPRTIFAKIANKIIIEKNSNSNQSQNYSLEDNILIGHNVLLCDNIEIGANSIIGNNVSIGVGVTIGRNCIIGSNVVINCAHIGDNVKIGANSVIGKSGFGVALGNGPPIDVPQFGRVIIQDNVTIGALCTIDKGAFADTIIGLNTKMDNHCHIAHNVVIGKNVVIAAFAGISGSTMIGDNVIMGGRVGIGDNLKIGDGAILAAGSAVLTDVPSGETFAGYPAKAKTKWMRELVMLAKLVRK